jgi:DNA polymerase III epsilon subunit-like protein
MPVTREDLLHRIYNLIEYGIVIDTETTGLGDGDTVVELAAVRVKDRSVLINTLVVPNSPMGDAAYRVHGITAVEASAGGITITDAFNQLHAKASALPMDKRIISAYNLPFDQRLITQSLHLEDDSAATLDAKMAWLEATGVKPDSRIYAAPRCIMELATRLFIDHLEWDSNRSSFKRLSLERCVELAGIKREGTAHRALSDVLATVDLLHYFAQHEDYF